MAFSFPNYSSSWTPSANDFSRYGTGSRGTGGNAILPVGWEYQFGVDPRNPMGGGTSRLGGGPIPGWYATRSGGGGVGSGSGLPSGVGGMSGDIMSMIKSMMSKLQGGGGATPVAPFQSPPQNSAQQYLQQIQALMGKMGAGGLPGLDPASAQAIAQAKTAGLAEINRNYEQAMGNAMAQGFGAGMDRSSISDFNRADLSGRKAQAVAELLSGLFGQEFGMRKDLAGLQQQGLMGQMGALQQLAQLAGQQDQQSYQRAREDYQTNLANQQNNQQQQMQMLQWLMQMMQQYGGQ